MAKSNRTHTLQSLLRFSPADLEANRARRLTETQQSRLDEARRLTWMIFMAAGALFLVVAVIAYLADVPTAALLFGTLGLLLLISFVWSLSRTDRRNQARTVGILQGKLSLRRNQRRRTGAVGSTTVHHLSIQGTEIPIRRELYDLLSAEMTQGDGIYTAYYVEDERILLALERGAVPLLAPPSAPNPGHPATDSTGQPAQIEADISGEQQAVRQAIDVLDGRIAPAMIPAQSGQPSTSDGTSLQQIRAAARASLIEAGPAVLPLLATRLHRTEYQQIAGAMGDAAIAPLMRLLTREGDLVESALIDGVVGAFTIMPWEILEKPLPHYLQPHHSPAVRMVALRVLSQRRNPQRLAMLRLAARDPEPTIAARAQHTLARLDNFYTTL